jgi:hypothetical protein
MKIPDLAGSVEKRDAAYEIKFVVPMAIAERAIAWARKNLSPDPHVGVNGNDCYHVNSLYFDTEALDVYRRNGSYGKAKYRVRRYGEDYNVFLERKLKSRGLVSKRRTRVADSDISYLANGYAPDEWSGYWFRRRLSARQLRPRCQIKYQRVARVGSIPEGSLRLTVDKDICSFATENYQVNESGAWQPLLPERCILELKFRLGLPPLFKSLVEELGLIPQPVSKYRLSIQAFGLAPEALQPVETPTNGPLPQAAAALNSCLPLLPAKAPVPEA